jgi:predicted RNA-binding Zn-ribbon protein involved in translation (DUF1610 family)
MFNAPDSAAGKTAQCPKCGGAIQIPGAAPAAHEDDVLDAEVLPSGPVMAAGESAAADSSADPDRRPCPMCGEMIARQAVKCRFCGEIFDPVLRAEALKQNKVGPDDSNLAAIDWVLCILCSTIGCIVGIVYSVQGKPKGWKMILISMGVAMAWTLISLAMQPQNRR